MLVPTHTATSSSAVERAAHAAEHAAESAAEAARAAAEAAAAITRMAQGAHAGAGGAAGAAGGGGAPGGDIAPGTETAPDVVWSANMGANLVLFAGNSEQIAIGADLAFERKSSDWIWAARLTGGYGESTSPTTGNSDTTALFATVALRGDRRFTEHVAAYLTALADTDHVKAIEYRVGGEGGASIRWFESKVDDYVKSALKTDLGLRAQKESRFQYFTQVLPDMTVIPRRTNLPDVSIVAPKLGIQFLYAISRDAVFTEDAEFLPNVIPDDTQDGLRVLINSVSKLSIKLNTALSFNTGLVLKFDNIPAPGKDDLDAQLNVGLSVTL